MGNVDSRAKFDIGYMIVQTDKPFYMPTEMVTGKIYLRIFKQFEIRKFELEVVGKEKGAWTDFEYVHKENENGESHMERVAVKRKKKYEFMKFKQPIANHKQFENPGDYVIPFAFTLP